MKHIDFDSLFESRKTQMDKGDICALLDRRLSDKSRREDHGFEISFLEYLARDNRDLSAMFDLTGAADTPVLDAAIMAEWLEMKWDKVLTFLMYDAEENLRLAEFELLCGLLPDRLRYFEMARAAYEITYGPTPELGNVTAEEAKQYMLGVCEAAHEKGRQLAECTARELIR